MATGSGGVVERRVVPESGGTFTGDVTVPSLNGGALAGFRNAIINGDFRVAQRGTSFTGATVPLNSDDTYLLDRWVLLSDGNDIFDVTQSTEAPTNGLYSCALDVETTNKKGGILQIIERKNCIGLIGQQVTFSFWAKVSATTKLDNVKCAILAWSSTADTVTSDVVSAWGVEGTNPTLATNWTYENTPANLSVTTTWARYTVTATIDTASTTNIAVFIWSDVTDTTAGDFLYVTDAQLERGSVATPFERRPFPVEETLCMYYAEWMGGEAAYQAFGAGGAGTTTTANIPVRYRTQKRVVPTVSVNTVSSLATNDGAFSVIALTVFSADHVSKYGFTCGATVAAGLTAGQIALLYANNNTTVRIKCEAEM